MRRGTYPSLLSMRQNRASPKDCPQGFDVRFMTEDERADWVQQLLTSIDLREVEVREMEDEEEDKAEKDFVLNNE